MLRRARGDEDVEIDETPTDERFVDEQQAALDDLEAFLDEKIGTDATVEIPNPLQAGGLDFTSDVFLDDRVDPSIERKMPELRNDPSVERKASDKESFLIEPTRPKAKTIPKAMTAKPPAMPRQPPSSPPPPPFAPPLEQFELEESIIEDALAGLDLSLRDPEAASADPSLVLDLQNPLTEEEIELAESVVTGEREVRSTPRLEAMATMQKIELSPELRVPTPVEHAVTPAQPAAAKPQAVHQRPATSRHPDEVRIGSRMAGMGAMLSFGGSAGLALLTSAWLSAAVGLLAVAVAAYGVIRARLGWKDELLHVIAAGAAVASSQPWALDLAQIGHVSFWRTPAAMACVGALIVGLMLALVAAERGNAQRA